MSLTAPSPVTLTPTTHRFFEDLITALGSHAALTAGYLTHGGNTGYRFLDESPLRMRCLTQRQGNSTLEVVVKPASILTPLTLFAWPTSLDLSFEVVTEAENSLSAPSEAAPLTGIQRMLANIMEHAFVAYYERCADEINNARSKAGPGGLPTLAFANVLRNAFAHGGVIHFTQAKAGVTVSWGGLSYSDRDNGRQVMYRDLSQGDVILLMLEMEKCF
jgi:hypothetical protein